jgi:gliding motility-associated-like protein
MSKNYNFFKFKSYFLLVSLLFFSKAFSANWYVNDNSTTGDVYCTAIGSNTNNGNSPATPKLTLGAAITAASPGDTIFIDTGTYSGTGNINLTVAKANLTFTGAGSLKTVFDNNLASANSNLWLTINANNINISGISATEFNAVSAGKVVTVNGQTVTFNDVIFFNNGNNGNGAIYITSNSNVTYSNSSTTCNASLLFGGGIDLVGNNSVLNITNCIIATNKKEDNGDGGGVLVKGNGNNVTITNSRFEKNDAVNGGAICIMGGTSAAPNLVNITGSCFENNKVSQVSSVVNGAAICIGRGGSTINVTDCSFTNNLAGTAASQTGNGGAISVNTGIVGGLSGLSGTATLNLLRCNFSGNNATAAGKHIYGDVVTGPAAVNINQCTFASAGNFDIAQKTAGEIAFTVTNSGTPTVSNLTLTNSVAPTQTAATVCQTFTGNGCTLPAPCTASLSYPNSSICSSASTQTPTFSPTGGTFTSTTGLSINASTGVITPSSSTAGTYTVTYTPNSADPTCTATFSITIVAAPVQPTIACYQTATFNTTTCSWDVTGTQPTQPTATNCWDDYQFNTTSCSWVNNGSQPTQPTATNCWDDYQFNTTSCSWVNNGSQPTQPTATNCWDDYQFNTTSCSWVNNGSQPTQPTATNCWDDYQFNTTSCTWVNNGTQPTQPTATNCWDDYQFNTTSCSWVNNGSQPTQPTATNCWDDYQFNTTSCSWVNNGSQPTQPTATNCWDDYQFNTTSCSWVNNGSQPMQPTATNCWDDYQFNTTSCTWVNNGSQPSQPAQINCWDNYQFNTTSCSWVNNGSQPTQPTATNCWDDYQFNTTSCTWVNNGSQPTQPTATNCWDDYQFNTTSCSWVNNGSQPTQPTATNCWDDYQFNTTSCSWVNNGSQPTQPTATNCWDDYQFNTTSCSWVNNGSQPTQPTATNCWDDYQFNTTSCSWVNNGSQPTQPTATNCWDDYQFNTTSCSWVNNGSQPTQPTATNCWDDYQFNTTSCTWVNNGSQPSQPAQINCWDNYQFNTTSCSWVNNGSQPTQPTATNCWDDYQFNTTSCSWVNNGSQPTQPTATNCWDDYQFNTTSCSWVNNGSQPTQPTATNCWDDYQFNTTSCTWVNNGSQPTQPTATNCWDDYQFNTTSCSWVNNGSQPTQPAQINCWDNYQFNTTSCSWVNNGSQPTQPTATNCWDDYQFNTTSCSWVNNGSQPSQPAQVNCWDDYQFNTTSCSWVNNGTQPMQPTATNCWDDYQFNTTSCSWVNNGSQPTQPTATNCWDDYQFNTTSCSWVNNGSQPTQPTATNCWDDYQFNTTSCSWVNNGTQPTQPTATNCWDDYQFNTTSCSWVNNGSQPTQPTATNCWDDYQFNTTSCTWVNNGSQPTQPTVLCYQTATWNPTSCQYDITGTQQAAPTIGQINQPSCLSSVGIFQINAFDSNYIYSFIPAVINISSTGLVTANPGTYTLTMINNLGCASQTSANIVVNQQPSLVAPLITVNNAICNGSTYSVSFNTNGTISASTGTISGNIITGIAVGTNVVLTATSLNGCATTNMTVTSPASCITPRGCVTPTLSAGQGVCSGIGTYSFAFNVSDNATITSSAGTISGNTVINIPIGIVVTLTAIDGLCSTSLQINSPSNCSTPCASPVVSFSAGICNGNTYSINISNPNNAIITSSVGTVTTNAIIGIPTGTSVMITSVISGCSPQVITILSPNKIAPLLIISNAICNGSTYSVEYTSNGNVTSTFGSVNGDSITDIPIGTNIILIATSLNGCATTSMTVVSPTNCSNPPSNCIMPTLSAGQGTCSGTGTYSFAFNASAGAAVSVSSGTIIGNTVTGITVGTNVTLTATNGSCVTSLVVNSPTDCSTPCATPVVSFSAGICNGTTYSINISNPNAATITASAGNVTATNISNIPVGTNVIITSLTAGCSAQIISVFSPQLAVTPFAGNDGNLTVCENVTPTNAELINALGGIPHNGGTWSNSGNVYTYTVQANSACSSIPFHSATVTINETIINNFAITGECVNENYQLSVSPIQNGVTYNWYDSNDTLLGTGTSIIINDNGTYHVESNLTNCKKIATITIENSNCIIPKGISPNGDGLNDSWNLSNLNIEKAQIFNRYGMEMFSKSNYTSEWHGQTNSGHILPSATYYYVLTLPGGMVRTGWVYLNREN